jgi:hypothetical protein
MYARHVSHWQNLIAGHGFYANSSQAKKARCTGARPCATCAERGLHCTYESRYLRGRPPAPLSPISDMPGAEYSVHQNPIPTPTSTLARYEHQNGSVAGQPSPLLSSGNRREEAAVTSSALNNRKRRQKDGPAACLGGLHGVDADLSSQSISRNSPDPASSISNAQYVDHTSALSFLHRAHSKSKTGNAHDATHIERSSQPLTAAGDKPLLGPPSSGLIVSAIILPTIPDAAEAKDLLDLYFEVCVATYKPLHRQTVDTWYHVVVNNIQQGLPIMDNLGNAKTAVLLGVLAIATFHRQKSRGFSEDAPSLAQSDAFFKVTANLIETETGEPHLESAQARLLQVFYLLMTCRMNQAWYIFGNLLQIIAALGMHRRSRKDKLYSRSRSNYIHSQCRIRTFWSAYILDRYLGVVMGRPRHFHDKDIDQDYPDRVDDANMSPSGRIPSDSDDTDECHIDGFIWNIKLAQFVGEVSDELYPIRPLPETQCISAARRLACKLEDWQESLPALLKANPKNLIRSFRRQNVALKLAYKHAVMHIYRPFLLNRSGNRTLPCNDDNDTQLFRRDSIRLCISAAQDALRTIDALAQEGPLFHAFWWTHYMTFCALSVTYVWNMQKDNFLEGIDKEALLTLAGRCQSHLAQATATNSPSRRYSIILEELGGMSANQNSMHSRNPRSELQLGEAGGASSAVVDEAALALSQTFGSGGFAQGALGNNMSVQHQDPFMHWTASDWLDLDASVSENFGETIHTSIC